MSIVELDQSYETPVTEFHRGPFKIRYAYARSRDCQDHNEKGQDYLVWRAESYRAAFSLCDGVTQSFFGGIGAQILGEAIIDWLWKIDIGNVKIPPSQLSQELHQLLDSQKVIATQLIEEKDITSVDTEIIRDALETRLKRKGTESNFVCGLIDPPNEYFPEGRVLLFWLGDAKLQIWLNTENNTSELNATWSSQEGWSSKFGIVGEIHHYQGSLQDLNCVIAHSDGLDPLSSNLKPSLPSIELDNEIKNLRNLPASDDISFVEISVTQSVVASEDDLVSHIRAGLMQNNAELPVKVLRQIEKIPVEKQITEIETNEKKVIPRWLVIIIAFLILTDIVTYPVGYHFGHINVSTSTPAKTQGNPPSRTIQLSTPIREPTWTLSPTETSTTLLAPTPSITETSTAVITPTQMVTATSTAFITPTQIITGYLPLEEIAIISPQSTISLTLGCNNLVTIGLRSNTSFQIQVIGSYQVKAYANPSCQGYPIVIYFKDANQPLNNQILSLKIEAFP